MQSTGTPLWGTIQRWGRNLSWSWIHNIQLHHDAPWCSMMHQPIVSLFMMGTVWHSREIPRCLASFADLYHHLLGWWFVLQRDANVKGWGAAETYWLATFSTCHWNNKSVEYVEWVRRSSWVLRHYKSISKLEKVKWAIDSTCYSPQASQSQSMIPLVCRAGPWLAKSIPGNFLTVASNLVGMK